MADITLRYEDNVDGAFYVDKNCIACDTCAGVAPEHFVLSEDMSHALVFFQPSRPDQTDKCHAALAACPVEAIGCV